MSRWVAGPYFAKGVTELNWANREKWLADGWKPGDPIPLDRAFGDESFASELRLFDAWNGHDDDRIKIIFGPHAADFISKELLLKVQEEARKRGAVAPSACRAGRPREPGDGTTLWSPRDSIS